MRQDEVGGGLLRGVSLDEVGCACEKFCKGVRKDEVG